MRRRNFAMPATAKNGGCVVVDIFDAAANAQEILDAVLVDGMTVVHGGRVAVREKLRLVKELAEIQGHEMIFGSSFNHPRTELAFPYDERRLSWPVACNIGVAAYDRAYPSS